MSSSSSRGRLRRPGCCPGASSCSSSTSCSSAWAAGRSSNRSCRATTCVTVTAWHGTRHDSERHTGRCECRNNAQKCYTQCLLECTQSKVQHLHTLLWCQYRAGCKASAMLLKCQVRQACPSLHRPHCCEEHSCQPPGPGVYMCGPGAPHRLQASRGRSCCHHGTLDRTATLLTLTAVLAMLWRAQGSTSSANPSSVVRLLMMSVK